ncbi:MAG: hypothetical protein AAF676_12830 [Pseudomonadota bacterium]
MSNRIALRAAALSAALALAALPLRADAPRTFDRTANGGVYVLSPAQAEALGVPGADRIAFIDLLTGEISGDAAFLPGDRFDAEAFLAMTQDDEAIRGFFNGEAGRADLVYAGFPFDPLREARLVAHRDIPRAVAFAFRDRDGPVAFAGLRSSFFDGSQAQEAFDGITIGGGGASPAQGRDEGRRVSVSRPAAAVFVALGIVGLYLSRYRFV